MSELRSAPRLAGMAYFLWLFPGGNHLYLGRTPAAVLQILLLAVTAAPVLASLLIAGDPGFDPAELVLRFSIAGWWNSGPLYEAFLVTAYWVWKVADLFMIPRHVRERNRAAAASGGGAAAERTE